MYLHIKICLLYTHNHNSFHSFMLYPKLVLSWKNFPLECYIYHVMVVTMIWLSWLKSNIIPSGGAVRREHGCGGDWFCFTKSTNDWHFSCYVFITASRCACLRHHLSCASACKNCFLVWPYKNVCRFTLHCLVSVWYYLRLSNAYVVLRHHLMFGMKCVLLLWL